MSSRARIKFRKLVVISALLTANFTWCQSTRRHVVPASPLTQARAQIAKHDLQAAENSIWQVLSADPNNSDALLLLGTVRSDQQRFAEAETLFNRVLQLDPNSAAAHLNLGKCYLAEKKLANAMDEYQKAGHLLPHDVEVHVTLAKLYAANGEFASALS